MRTVAGTGEPGFAGDRGRALAARLNEPKSLALSPDGRWLYIADSENHVIRRMNLERGLIETVAGRADVAPSETLTMESPPFWAEEDDPLGGPTVAMPELFRQQRDLSGTVRFLVGTAPKAGRFQGDGGPAVEAALNFPTAAAVDEQGTLYIADTMNHRIRKVEAATGAITTLAGTGQHRFSGDGGPATAAALNEPAALVLDGQGHLYVADQSNNRVRCVDLATGLISTVAGTGEAAYGGDGMPATEAALAGPSGLALDGEGRLYIADTFNGRIRMVDLSSGIISTIVGDGGDYRYQGHPTELSTSLSRPYGIALEPGGHLLMTDSDSHLIRRWDSKRRLITVLAGNGMAGYSGDGGSPEAGSLNYPFGVAVDSEGNVYVADTFNHRIRLIAA